jgi:ribonuclease VapC
MVIDTSALVSIAIAEPSWRTLADGIIGVPLRAMSSVSLLETGIVLRRRVGVTAVEKLYELVEKMGIEVVAFDSVQAKLAFAAFTRFGKGMGHRAQLNFGDCAVYALAQSRGEPVLAIGRDFASTDIALVTF